MCLRDCLQGNLRCELAFFRDFFSLALLLLVLQLIRKDGTLLAFLAFFIIGADFYEWSRKVFA